MVSSSPFAGLVSVIVVVALLGGLAFLGMSGTELVNPETGSAKAEMIKSQTQVDAERAKIETDALRQRTDMQLAFERKQQELSLKRLEAAQARELARQEMWMVISVELERALAITAMVTGSLAALMLCGSLALAIVRYARAHFPVSQAERQPAGQPADPREWDKSDAGITKTPHGKDGSRDWGKKNDKSYTGDGEEEDFNIRKGRQ